MTRCLFASRLLFAVVGLGAAVACGGGGGSSPGGGSLPPVSAPTTAPTAVPLPLSTTVAVSAAQGGTVSLPDGSSVAIPPGALSGDTNVTLSLNPQASPVPLTGASAASVDSSISFGARTGQRGVGTSPGSAISRQVT